MALHDLCALSAEALGIVFLLVNVLWRVGVEVEGVPCGGEGIVRVGLLVLLDGELESVFADVTPEGLWSVFLFGPAEASEATYHGQTVSLTMSML